MPLVRTSDKTPPSATTADPVQHPRDQLAAGSADDRRQAARALAADPDAATLLAERLHVEPEPMVRDALFASLVDDWRAAGRGTGRPAARQRRCQTCAAAPSRP